MSPLSSFVSTLRRSNPFTFRTGLKGDLIITLINGFGVIIGIFILYGLISRVMGIEALGQYLLVRRTSLSLINILLLGMNIGLPYYIARGEDRAYGTAALLIFLLVTIPLIGGLAGLLYKGFLPGYPHGLASPFFFFTLAYAAQYMAYGLLRGHLNILGANLLKLLGTGIIPLCVFLVVYADGVRPLIIATGLGTAILAVLVYLAKMGTGYYKIHKGKIKKLVAYSLQRVPTFAADFILLAGVPLLIVNEASMGEIAYLNSGISLIRLFLVVVGPIGIVLLPRIAKVVAAGQTARVARNLELLCQAILFIGLPLALLLSMNSRLILSIWLRDSSEIGVWVLQFVLLALPFYLLMEVLGSPIDAAATRGYNSIAHGAAAGVLLIVYYSLKLAGLGSIEAGVFSFISGYVTVAIASLYYSYKLYGINLLRPLYLGTLVIMTSGFMLLNYVLSHVTSDILSFLLEGIALAIGLSFYLLKGRSSWVVDLRALVTSG